MSSSVNLFVQALPPTRTNDAIAVLTSAFIADPIFSHFFPDRSERMRVFDAFFSDLVPANLRFGHVYCAFDGDKMLGVAVWHPPHAEDPTPEDRARSEQSARQIARISKTAAQDLFDGFAELAKLHPAPPHWYLMFIGVDLDSRSKHVGSSLMEPVLTLADRRGELCYLETPFPETRSFYQKLGFQVARTCQPFRGASAIWTMRREASN